MQEITPSLIEEFTRHPVYMAFIGHLKKQIINDWQNSEDKQERDDLWHRLKLIGTFESWLLHRTAEIKPKDPKPEY